uniref:Thioredoxin domain-containing protein n=1 Tax=Saimiri boliviensis boliviensis TaxID=39432 RepID=A0A2K6TM66_SAIBB
MAREVSVSGFGFHRAGEQHNVVREGLKHVREGCVFIYCQAGDKPYWKTLNNVTAVPTLLKYGTQSVCLQANLVKTLFSED